MKRILLFLLLCGTLLGTALAQETDANTPATKEEVARYFEVVHSRQTIDQMMAVMSKSVHQLTHDQYLKHKDKLPQDFEEQTNKHVDEMFKNMPWDEMMQAMMPAYEKHFSKGDIDSLVAFYSSPTGQKLLRELPGVLSDSMQAMTPILQKYMESVKEHVNDEFAQALKDSGKKSN
jgi:uncharacterized protein